MKQSLTKMQHDKSILYTQLLHAKYLKQRFAITHGLDILSH